MNGTPYANLRAVPAVVIAAGHGASDSGACSGKHTERDEVITIVDLTAALLRPILGEGAVIIAPHKHDTHDTIKWLNKSYAYGTAWALEIHRDSAGTVTGEDADLRCGVYHGDRGDSPAIAADMVRTMKTYGAGPKSWARSHRDSPHGSLGWIRQPLVLSHLVELGFMEGRNDPAHLARLARILAGGIAHACTGRLYQFPTA